MRTLDCTAEAIRAELREHDCAACDHISTATRQTAATFNPQFDKHATVRKFQHGTLRI